MANLQDSDLLLVNRNDKSYKVTTADLKDYYVEPPTISSVVLTEKEDLGADRFNEQSFISTVTSSPGRPPADMSIKGTINANIIDRLRTSEITNIGTASDSWNGVTGLDSTQVYYDVAFGILPNGQRRWVAVGEDAGNNIAYSDDGINWTQVSVTEQTGWRGVCFGNGKFVAVSSKSISNNGAISMVSEDGITWEMSTSNGLKQNWYRVAYGNGKYVAIGIALGVSYVAGYSSNGTSWFKIADSKIPKNRCQGITFGNGKFVITQDTGVAYYSIDGINWEESSLPYSGIWSIAYGNGKYVAVSFETSNGLSQVAYSTDAITWTTASSAAVEQWYAITYGNGIFVAVAQDSNTVMFSADGINWTQSSNAISNNKWTGITYGEGKFVSVARGGSDPRGMYAVAGGSSLTELTFATNKDLELFKGGDTVTQENDQASGQAFSTDPATKTMKLVTESGAWQTGQTVVGPPRKQTTDEITNVTTETGKKWTSIRSNEDKGLGQSSGFPSSQVADILWTGTQWLICTSYTSGKQLCKSTNGLDWTQTHAGSGSFQKLGYDPGTNTAVAVGYPYAGGGSIFTSNDGGNTWTNITTIPGSNDNFKDVAYGDNKWLVPAGSYVLLSADGGLSWSNVPTPPGIAYNYCAYGANKFVIAGESGQGSFELAVSDDGIIWEKLPKALSAPSSLNALTYQNNQFLILGNDIGFWSENGTDWYECVVPKANYRWKSAAYGDGVWNAVHEIQNHDSRKYVMSSYDGKNWFLADDSYTGYSTWSAIAYGELRGDKAFLAVQAASPVYMGTLDGVGNQTTLTFASDKNLSDWKSGVVTQDDNAASGVSGPIDVAAKTMTVGTIYGTWSANTGNFVVGANDAGTETVEMFCKLDSDLKVTDLQSSDPGFTAYTGTTPTIEFPYYLPNGEPVDSTLLEGSSIYTTVKADNVVTPAVTKDSNVVTPASTCDPGPIETAPIANVGVLSGAWVLEDTMKGGTYRSVTYGNGLYVAVANNGSRFVGYSFDGITWAELGSSDGVNDRNWYGVTFGDGKFVAVGEGYTMHSTNGLSWTESTNGVNANQWRKVTYGNGKFVAVASNGSDNRAMYSSDGKNWTVRGTLYGVENNYWYDIAYGNGRFVAVAYDGNKRTMYSSDGMNWTGSSLGVPAQQWRGVAYGQGKFVAVGSGESSNHVMYSENGESWTGITGTSNGIALSNWESIDYGRGKFVTFSNSGSRTTMFSYDGINWNTDGTDILGAWGSIVYGDDKYVVVSYGGNGMVWSYTAGIDEPLLTFENAKGLDELNPDDDVTQANAAASGRIGLINTDALTMWVTASSGTWEVGQTVFGPNRICPPISFDASDPADVAQFEAVKASFEGYETSKKLHRASLISRMLAAGFTQQQISALDLDTADVALNINGYYPLYTTEAVADAAGNGASHAHEIDGVTYYMPDGGVDIYHGNYNEPEDTTSDSTDSGSTDTTDSDDSGSSSSGGGYGY